MGNTHPPIIYKGRTIGTLGLTAAQILIGLIHVVFGLWLFTASPDTYSVYTIAFGGLTLVFAAGLWLTNRWGWIGTVTIAVFVIAADTLTLLNLPSIPGIPKFAGYGEITYSSLILIYLAQVHVRAKYKIGTN
jgi:hypothetical protein